MKDFYSITYNLIAFFGGVDYSSNHVQLYPSTSISATRSVASPRPNITNSFQLDTRTFAKLRKNHDATLKYEPILCKNSIPLISIL